MIFIIAYFIIGGLFACFTVGLVSMDTEFLTAWATATRGRRLKTVAMGVFSALFITTLWPFFVVLNLGKQAARHMNQ